MWANTAPSGGLIAIGNPHPQAGARGDGQRAAAPERAPAPGRGKRQSCSCAAGGAGPRRRRSRWATSSGRTAGGAFVEAARPPTRPASPSPLAHRQRQSSGRGHRVERRAPSRRTRPGLGQRPLADPVAHPPAGGRGDGRRAAGAGVGRRHQAAGGASDALGRGRRQSEAAERTIGHIQQRDGLSFFEEASPRGRRIARPTARTRRVTAHGRGYRFWVRAPSRRMKALVSDSVPSPIASPHPHAGGRGDGRRVAGAGTGRRHRGCAKRGEVAARRRSRDHCALGNCDALRRPGPRKSCMRAISARRASPSARRRSLRRTTRGGRRNGPPASGAGSALCHPNPPNRKLSPRATADAFRAPRTPSARWRSRRRTAGLLARERAAGHRGVRSACLPLGLRAAPVREAGLTMGLNGIFLRAFAMS
jgi:hypothetical protein